MKRVKTEEITNWKIAKKVKNIRAKPLISIMVDRSVTNKFLVDTLEGKEPLGDGAVICIGEAGDAWQQMPKKLIQKYNVIEIDKDGWMVCEPRPDNSVNCIEITGEILYDVPGFVNLDYNECYIIAQWGEQTSEGLIQKANIGDYVCQNREDLTDIWIVTKKIFNNTYTIING